MRARRSSAAPLLASIAGLGGAALATQLALLRELMAAFGGNELLLGAGLGFWLLATAAGSRTGNTFAGAATSTPGIAWRLGWPVLALLPLVQLFAIQVGRDAVFLPGAAASPAAAALFGGIVLAPYGLLSGAWLARAAALLCATCAPPHTARLYAADVAGAVLGGALFSFAMAPRLDSWSILLLSGGILLAVVGLSEGASGCTRWAALQGSLAAAFFAATVAGGWEQRALALVHGPGAEVRSLPSPYRRIVEMRAHGQTSVFLDGHPSIASGDSLFAEELAHYALSQRPGGGRVLVIGTGPAALVSELARHSPGEIVVLEPDPALRSLAAAWPTRHTAMTPPVPVVRLGEEARRYLAGSQGVFSAIIVAEPPPSNVQLNRHYTAEFFEEAHRALIPGGVLLVSAGDYANAVSPGLAALLSGVRATLGRAFAHQLPLPGVRVHFLASDAPLTARIGPALAERSIVPDWLTDAFLSVQLAEDRLAQLDHASRLPAAPNRDLRPTLPPLLQQLWLNRFGTDAGWLGPALAGAAALALILLRPVPRIAFAAGFAGGTLELVLLFAYQALFGSLHLQVGLLVTAFMGGMAVGAGFAGCATSPQPNDRARDRARVLLLLAGCALAAFVLPLALSALGRVQARLPAVWLGECSVMAAACLLGIGTGASFPLALRLSGRTDTCDGAAERARVLATLYAADCLGAAAGSLVSGLWLLPREGLFWTCTAAAGTLLAAGAGLLLRRRPRPDPAP